MPAVTVIDAAADAFRRRLEARHPLLGQWVALRHEALDPAEISWMAPSEAIDRLAQDDPVSHWIFSHANLPHALALYRGMTMGLHPPAAIHVARPLGAGMPISDSISSAEGISVRFYGKPRDAAPISVALNSALERIARGFHDRWKGESGPSYDSLPETMRKSNWRAALHALLKLRLLGFASIDATSPSLGLSETDLRLLRERATAPGKLLDLGELEHIRWCVDRILDGWRPGDVRDDGARTRPQLRHGRGAYGELSKAETDKDRDQILSLVDMLAGAVPAA
jgi:hypothetical protein